MWLVSVVVSQSLLSASGEVVSGLTLHRLHRHCTNLPALRARATVAEKIAAKLRSGVLGSGPPL